MMAQAAARWGRFASAAPNMNPILVVAVIGSMVTNSAERPP
jgi:hypothetical protein